MPPRAAAPRAWQRMLSGRRLDLLDPSPFDIEIEDIAHGLARVARWNGQTAGAQIFSVAQHSLLVEAFVREMDALQSPAGLMAALLHDAPEYVIGDMISPFKAVIGTDYKLTEAKILGAIHLRFGLRSPSPPALARLVKQADRASAAVEAVRLAGFAVPEALKLFGAAPALADLEALLAPCSSQTAQQRFLRRFHALEGEMMQARPVETGR